MQTPNYTFTAKRTGINFAWIGELRTAAGVYVRSTANCYPSKPHAVEAAERITIGYTTVGDVRGECRHLHRTVDAAETCRQRDMDGCGSQGGYSDRAVVAVQANGQTRELRDNE